MILVGIFLLFCGYSSYIEYTNDEYEIISYVDKNNRTCKLYNRSLYLDTTIKPVFIGKEPDNTRNGYYLFEIDEFGHVVTVVMKDSEKIVIAQPYLSYKNILDEFYKDLSEKNKDISVGVSGIK